MDIELILFLGLGVILIVMWLLEGSPVVRKFKSYIVEDTTQLEEDRQTAQKTGHWMNEYKC